MKITHNKVGQNLNTKDTGKSEKAGASGGASASAVVDALAKETGKSNDATKVNVSDRAQQMKRAQEIAMNAPDVDEAKVARLQKLIDEGKYKVEAKDIADKMVDDHVAW